MTYTGVRRKPTTVPALNVGGHYRRQAVPQARTARPSHDVSRRRSRPCRGSRSGCSGSHVPQACLLTMYLSQPAAVSFHSEQQDYARGAISCERELIGSPIQGRRQPDARSHLHSPGCEPHLPQCPCDWWCSACERTSIAIAIGQVMGDQALSAAIHIQAHTDGAVPAFVQAPAVRLACTGSACLGSARAHRCSAGHHRKGSGWPSGQVRRQRQPILLVLGPGNTNKAWPARRDGFCS